MNYIKESEYIHLAPENLGEVVRVNHYSPTCQGDSKSMRITRGLGGAVYAKCYRCGGFGRAGGEYFRTERALSTPHSGKCNVIRLPYDIVRTLEEFPPFLRAKLYKYGVSSEDVNEFGLGWSGKMQRFIIPVYKNAELVGWQGRYYGEDVGQPKYITKYQDKSNLFSYIPKENNSHLVVVEDMISGIRVRKYANTLVLMGNSMSDEALTKAMKNKTALVFLDYDNKDVVMKSFIIKERLQSVGIDAKIHHQFSSPLDPKEMSDSELKRIVK